MKVLFMILILFFSFSETGHATDVSERIYEEIGFENVVESVPEEVGELLHGLDITTGQGFEAVLTSIKTKMLDTVQTQISIALRPLIQTMIIIFLCGIVLLLMPEKHHEFPIMAVGCTVIVYLNLGDARSYFSDAVELIRGLYDFSSVLLPCLAGASVISGATISAGVKYTSAALFMNILLNFSNTVLVPMVSIYLVCMIGNTVFQQPVLGSISSVIHKLCITILSASVVIFTTYLGVAGLVSGTGEALSVRIAKMTLSTGLPIVGKVISDAASTLVVGASLLRNGIGLFGMLALTGMIIVPFISIGIRYLLFKLIGNLNDLWSEQHFTTLLKGISEAYGMMLAIIGSGFIMLFFTLLSFMQVANV